VRLSLPATLQQTQYDGTRKKDHRIVQSNLFRKHGSAVVRLAVSAVVSGLLGLNNVSHLRINTSQITSLEQGHEAKVGLLMAYASSTVPEGALFGDMVLPRYGLRFAGCLSCAYIADRLVRSWFIPNNDD
jgi:hypothetical protein